MSVQVKGSGTIGGIDEGLVVSGIVTATSLDVSGDIDVDGHTNLDNVSIAGVTTSAGIVQAIQFKLLDNAKAVYGNSADMEIYHNATNSLIQNGTGSLQIVTSSDLYQQAASDISFNTGGSNERLRIKSNGQIGLGTDSPSGMFEVQKNGVPAIISNYNNSKHIQMGAGSNGAGFHLTDGNFYTINHQPYADRGTDNNLTERFRIASDGRISINDSSPSSNETLTIRPNGNIACDVSLKMNHSTDSRIKFYDDGGVQRGTFGFTNYANNTTYPNFHDSFYMQTDPSSNGTLATVMRINREGAFMYPKQPCFSVAMSGDYTTSTSHTGNFSVERFDQGDNFNTGSNGIFTAPVTGKYYMHAAIQTMQAGASQAHIMGVSFTINGSVQSSKGSGDQYLGRNGDHYITVHCIRILNLAQGDTVQVYIQLHGQVRIEGSGGTDRCNWQGYLMA